MNMRQVRWWKISHVNLTARGLNLVRRRLVSPNSVMTRVRLWGYEAGILYWNIILINVEWLLPSSRNAWLIDFIAITNCVSIYIYGCEIKVAEKSDVAVCMQILEKRSINIIAHCLKQLSLSMQGTKCLISFMIGWGVYLFNKNPKFLWLRKWLKIPLINI